MVELKVAIKTVSDLGQVLQQHVRDLRQFNATLRNGSAALQQLLGGAAAWLSLAGARQALRQAQDQAVALARLHHALGAAAAQHRAALTAQADALEQLTGTQADTILSVQQMLLGLGATADQTRRLTPLVLDLAASMGLNAVSAARMLGGALDGQTLTLGRFNLQARTFDELVRQLSASVRGQAAAAYNAQGPLGRLELAWRRLAEAAGRLALGPVGAFAETLTARVERLTARLEAAAQAHPDLVHNLNQLAATLATTAAALAPFVLALWALRGAATLLAPVLNLTRLGLAALAGPLQDLTKTAGLAFTLKNQFEVMAAGGLSAATRLAAAFRLLGGLGAALTAAISGWGLGRWLAAAFEIGGLTLDEWLESLYHRVWGQLRKLAALLTTTGAERAAELARIEADTAARLADLERQAAERRAARAGRNTPAAPAPEPDALLPGLRAELERVRAEGEAGLDAARLPARRAQQELGLAQLDEAHRRGLVNLDHYLARRHALLEARLRDENATLTDQLTLLEERLALKRLEVADLREQEETPATLRRLAELERERLELETKRAELAGRRETNLRQFQIEELQLAEKAPLGFLGRLRADLATFATEVRAAGDTFASGLVAVVQNGCDQMSAALGNIITGVTTAGQAWLDLGRFAVQSLIKIVAQYIAGQLAMAAVDTFITNKKVAENARTTISGLAAGAGQSAGTGGWVGLLVYMATATAVMAALMALATAVTGGFAQGGYTGAGPRDEPAGLVHRGEWVMPAATVAAWGPEVMAAIQAGPAAAPAGAPAPAYYARPEPRRLHLYLDKAAWLDACRDDFEGLALSVFQRATAARA